MGYKVDGRRMTSAPSPAQEARLSTRGRSDYSLPMRTKLALVALLMAGLLAPGPAGAETSDYFPQTGFGLYQPLIRRYYLQNGGYATFGYPISREFRLRGETVQLFERAAVRVGGDLSVGTMDLAREGLPAPSEPGHPPGQLLKAVLYGGPLPPGMADSAVASPLFHQYDPATHTGPLRPEALPDTDLTDAFRPLRYSDPSYGVVVTTLGPPETIRQVLDQANLRWWYQYQPQDGPAPYHQVQLVSTRTGAWDVDAIRSRAAARPSSYWLVGNEPNVPGQDDISPEAYAVAFAQIVGAIKDGDPEARIVAPNVLNWEETCLACPGITRGREWADRFLSAYQRMYGGPPPIDVWGIHPYQVDWVHLPQTDADHVRRELVAMRAYLDSDPSQRDKPIWVTELGVLWGYDGLVWMEESPGVWKALPVGSYREDLLEAWLGELLDWLESEGRALGVERWFLYSTSAQPEPYSPVGSGLYLLDGEGPGAGLTRIGLLYACRAAGLAPDLDTWGCKDRPGLADTVRRADG